MWIAMILPILVVFIAGLMVIVGAGNAKSGAGASVRLFVGGAMVFGAGYAFIALISKLT